MSDPLQCPDKEPPKRGGDVVRAHRIALGVLAGGLLLLGVYTLQNFLGSLAWAAILAIALWPLYSRVVSRLGNGRHGVLLPGLFTVGAALVFVVPVLMVGAQLAREFHTAAEWLRDAREHGIPQPEFVGHLPFAQAQIGTWWQQNLADPASAKQLVERYADGRVAGEGRQIGEEVAHRLTMFVFTLLTLFFLLKEAESVTRQMRRAAERTFGFRGERIGQQIIASVHGTVNGLVLVGLGEGAVLGIVYAFAGVPHATVFGVLTALAAMIPFAAPVVILVAALLLVAQGSLIWGVGVFCCGMVVTFIADHFIRPELIGGAIKLPFIWVLLGILGGLEVWGLIGLFLGPAIMASLILLWREWADDRPA